MGVGAESFQGNEICEQSNCFLFRFKTLTNNIKPSRNQQLLDHWKVPKKPNKFYFIFPKGRRIVKKTKTHHVTQMPQAMQNMKTQLNAAAAAAQNLSLEINSSIRQQPKFHSKGPESSSSSSSSLFPSLKCLSNSIM
jgi:hypothetical protein